MPIDAEAATPWLRRQVRGRSIRLRIVAAFSAAVCAMLALVVFLLAWQQPVTESLQLVSDGYLPLATVVARLQDDHERASRELNRMSKGRPRALVDASGGESGAQDVAGHIDAARVITARLRRQADHVEELAVLNKIGAYVDEVSELFEQYELELTAASDRLDPDDEDPEEIRKPLRATERELAEAISKLDDTVSARIRALATASEQRQARGRTLALTGALSTTLAMAVLVGAVISALRPIGRLTDQVGRIGAGDYSRRVEASGEDEVGLLARAVNSMADAIASRDRDLQARASELARLGRYLSSVLDSLDDALIVLEDGQVTLANPAAARWGVHGPGPLPDVLQAVTGTGRHVLQPGDGSHHAVRSVPFGDRGAVLITSDMTRDVRSRERLARSEQLAMVGQMLGQVAHEVRNPLNALSLNAELLSDELAALDPDGRTDAGPILTIISAEISRLDNLTGRYLELVRQPPPALQGVDVGALLRDVARLAAPTAAAAGCEVDVAVSELPPQLIDGNQLRQATLNVLKNAVQADARKVKLGLEVADTVLRVVVRDDGPGMDEEALHRATEPFFTTKVTGTGLGLSVTRQIVEDHEGSLRLASVPGEGTTVTIELPRRDAVEGLRGEEGA